VFHPLHWGFWQRRGHAFVHGRAICVYQYADSVVLDANILEGPASLSRLKASDLALLFNEQCTLDAKRTYIARKVLAYTEDLNTTKLHEAYKKRMRLAGNDRGHDDEQKRASIQVQRAYEFLVHMCEEGRGDFRARQALKTAPEGKKQQHIMNMLNLAHRSGNLKKSVIDPIITHMHQFDFRHADSKKRFLEHHSLVPQPGGNVVVTLSEQARVKHDGLKGMRESVLRRTVDSRSWLVKNGFGKYTLESSSLRFISTQYNTKEQRIALKKDLFMLWPQFEALFMDLSSISSRMRSIWLALRFESEAYSMLHSVSKQSMKIQRLSFKRRAEERRLRAVERSYAVDEDGWVDKGSYTDTWANPVSAEQQLINNHDNANETTKCHMEFTGNVNGGLEAGLEAFGKRSVSHKTIAFVHAVSLGLDVTATPFIADRAAQIVPAMVEKKVITDVEAKSILARIDCSKMIECKPVVPRDVVEEIIDTPVVIDTRSDKQRAYDERKAKTAKPVKEMSHIAKAKRAKSGDGSNVLDAHEESTATLRQEFVDGKRAIAFFDSKLSEKELVSIIDATQNLAGDIDGDFDSEIPLFKPAPVEEWVATKQHSSRPKRGDAPFFHAKKKRVVKVVDGRLDESRFAILFSRRRAKTRVGADEAPSAQVERLKNDGSTRRERKLLKRSKSAPLVDSINDISRNPRDSREGSSHGEITEGDDLFRQNGKNLEAYDVVTDKQLNGARHQLVHGHVKFFGKLKEARPIDKWCYNEEIFSYMASDIRVTDQQADHLFEKLCPDTKTDYMSLLALKWVCQVLFGKCVTFRSRWATDKLVMKKVRRVVIFEDDHVFFIHYNHGSINVTTNRERDKEHAEKWRDPGCESLVYERKGSCWLACLTGLCKSFGRRNANAICPSDVISLSWACLIRCQTEYAAWIRDKLLEDFVPKLQLPRIPVAVAPVVIAPKPLAQPPATNSTQSKGNGSAISTATTSGVRPLDDQCMERANEIGSRRVMPAPDDVFYTYSDDDDDQYNKASETAKESAGPSPYGSIHSGLSDELGISDVCSSIDDNSNTTSMTTAPWVWTPTDPKSESDSESEVSDLDDGTDDCTAGTFATIEWATVDEELNSSVVDQKVYWDYSSYSRIKQVGLSMFDFVILIFVITFSVLMLTNGYSKIMQTTECSAYTSLLSVRVIETDEFFRFQYLPRMPMREDIHMPITELMISSYEFVRSLTMFRRTVTHQSWIVLEPVKGYFRTAYEWFVPNRGCYEIERRSDTEFLFIQHSVPLVFDSTVDFPPKRSCKHLNIRLNVLLLFVLIVILRYVLGPKRIDGCYYHILTVSELREIPKGDIEDYSKKSVSDKSLEQIGDMHMVTHRRPPNTLSGLSSCLWDFIFGDEILNFTYASVPLYSVIVQHRAPTAATSENMMNAVTFTLSSVDRDQRVDTPLTEKHRKLDGALYSLAGAQRTLYYENAIFSQKKTIGSSVVARPESTIGKIFYLFGYDVSDYFIEEKIIQSDAEVKVKIFAQKYQRAKNTMGPYCLIDTNGFPATALPTPSDSATNAAGGCLNRLANEMLPPSDEVQEDFSSFIDLCHEQLVPLDDYSIESFDVWLSNRTNWSSSRRDAIDKAITDTIRILDASRNKSFIKDEFYPSFKWPRAINSYSDEVKAYVGATIKAIEKSYYAQVSNVCIKGTDPRQLKKRLDKFIGAGVRVCDFSSFEAHHTGVYSKAFADFILHMTQHCTDRGPIELIVSLIRGQSHVQFRQAQMNVRERLMSGAMWTSLQNFYLNYVIQLYIETRLRVPTRSLGMIDLETTQVDVNFLIEGDDGLVTYHEYNKILFKKIVKSMNVLLKVDYYDDVYEAGFCSNYIDVAGIKQGEDENISRIVVDPIKTISKMIWMPKHMMSSNDSKRLALLKGVVLSAKYRAWNAPIVGPYCDHLLNMLSSITERRNVYDNGYNNFIEEAKASQVWKSPAVVTDTSRSLVSRLFGISHSEQLRLERELTTPGMIVTVDLSLYMSEDHRLNTYENTSKFSIRPTTNGQIGMFTKEKVINSINGNVDLGRADPSNDVTIPPIGRIHGVYNAAALTL